ncbi:glyoxalase bleomycin resistance dioxygenase [Pyrenophora seminiperda CCB06]|uniref:Glyoxalase bleomycin resistance dioxygenase n=1 Tax=Pyrenophora seminiperda CCB06 TaxID=1302712 RepID=A0A3M7MBG9_9PLEO|nr:glyoxalase bleomycin resistance dioxygenase [Pyrenophora seminiperda CCB06]
MLRRFSKSKRSSDSAAAQKRPLASSYQQPSRASAPIPETTVYSPRSSATAPRTLVQRAHTFDQMIRSYTQSPRSSDQRPVISEPMSGYNTESQRSSGQDSPYSFIPTPRSSASAPSSFPLHPLSPPSSEIPYDSAAWATHAIQLSTLLTKANNLDTFAYTAELRWKAAESALPPSRQHEVDVFSKIPVLRKVHILLRQVRKLGRTEGKWRLQWMPSSPGLKYPAWGSCYAEAVEVYEGEGVSPDSAVGVLMEKVEGLTGIVRGWIEKEIWGEERWGCA